MWMTVVEHLLMVQWVDGSIPHGGPLSHSLLQQSASSLGPTQKKLHILKIL